MIYTKTKENCCGCSACMSICSKGAITMKPDALGFLYPEINKDNCNGCGLCERVCAFNPGYNRSLNLKVPDVYAVRHKEMREIQSSRSGAMFIAISDWILEHGGVVYGVGYTEHFRVIHKRADNKNARDEFKGSKYVQSDVETCFSQVKEDLKSNLFVLFSGTPCQTSGLQSYLSKLKINTEKLYVCDIVCHGVPSPYFWRDYLSFIEKKQGKKASNVNFRNKSELGWSAHKESFEFKDRVVYTDTFTYLFYKHIMFQKSCGVCHFTNFQRPSDITIADFWGWQKVDTAFNADDKGVSLVLVNTEKGQKLFQILKEQLNYIKTDVESCLQPNLQHPSTIHPKRDQFEHDYMISGFNKVFQKYGNTGWRFHTNKLIRKVYSKGRRMIKKIVKI